MTLSSWERSRHGAAAAASVLAVTAIVAGVAFLVLNGGVPQRWWPHTKGAFTTNQTRSEVARNDPCHLIAGPGRAYCERDAAAHASAGHQDVADGAWRLVPAGAGVGALVVWLLRSTGQRRR